MITKNIARLLADGKGRKAEQIAAALVLTLEQTRLGLEILRRHSRVRTREGIFRITEKGAAFADQTDYAAYVKRAAAQQARRAREKGASPKAKRAEVLDIDQFPRPNTESVVRVAIASRPALQAAWSAL